MSEKLTMTVDQAAKELGISRSLAYEGVRTGQIPSLRIGRRFLIPRLRLAELLAGASSNVATIPSRSPA